MADQYTPDQERIMFVYNVIGLIFQTGRSFSHPHNNLVNPIKPGIQTTDPTVLSLQEISFYYKNY